MSLQNAQVEFAELILTNEQTTDLVQPPANLVVYHHSVLSNLTNALKSTYPLTVQLIGETAFEAAARDYIEQYPSCSGNLDEYGEYFSYFIANYPPAFHLVYLPEVASFEWTCHIIYRAADTAPLNQEQLTQVAEEDYPRLTFLLHPASSLMQFHYPILNIIDLCKGKIDQIDALETTLINLLLIRRHREIVLIPLETADYQFLHALQHGQQISCAAQAAIDVDADFKLDDKLGTWINNNTIVDFTLP